MSDEANNQLTLHRGMATWGERLVPLERFRLATAKAGRVLSEAERRAQRQHHLARKQDSVPIEGPYSRVVVFGGVYSNHLALEALLQAAHDHGAEAVYCLGDLGGFGPSPEKVWALLRAGEVSTLQGNYEASLASGREDCNCGYTDPRDNHFAGLSYSYTAENCSADFKRWMGGLPQRRRIRLGRHELLLVHGSPRQTNEFLFHSTSPVPFLEVLLDQEACDGLLCTHTGLHWHRHLPSGRDVVNVGVIGRPANNGRTVVWYALLEERGDALGVELLPLRYDHESLALEMQQAGLPQEFIDTIRHGWWTTCLEILPARERSVSRY